MLQKGRLENLADEIWKGAIKLRAKFKAKDYPTVILPMIMIRRIECVLEVKREEFANEIKSNSPDIDEETLKERVKLKEKNFLPFFNETYWTLESILDESSSQVESNFRNYLNGFSKDIDDVIDKFNYRHTVQQMVKANRLKKYYTVGS
ncbi:MAG: type I restriction-modification system subunit M N-terminal domain-containing protein [Balneolaceae bacterium]|nr:type I restriction-modification system subunit M N-terminal domain-containing protein [Balneolaceae bacterium]